jgi:hypothetical protein
VSIVNLNKARKSRAKDEARKAADANAVKFGRTKAAKSGDAAETVKTAQTLDGARREP